MKKHIKVIHMGLLKEGVANGRAWQLAKIVDQDNVEFTTFNPTRYREGEEYDIEYTEEMKGQYLRRGIVEGEKKKVENAQKEVLHELLEEVRAIKRILEVRE
jgi:hypothetical protein